jgi:ribose transport system substrate-binding protein
VQDLVAKKVDGIAVSPSNAAAMAVALQAAKEAGIPVLTWDSDLLPEDQDLRVAYIGTHNYEIGTNLAKLIKTIKPNGGTVCIQSGGAAAANHNERMQGIRDELSAHQVRRFARRQADRPGRLDRGRGLPALHRRRLPARRAAVRGLHGEEPDRRRLRADGRLPAVHPDANRAAVGKYKDKIASKELALVVADTLPVQIDQMKEGLSLGQVGQRPFEMGYKTMMALRDMKDGKAAPADPTYTGLDVCTPETADTCIAK